MNIAVLEDNKNDRREICSYIESYCKANCFEAHIKLYCNGEALFVDFEPGHFDLLFIDIFLPGISGVEVARKIRETDRDCMFVFITISPDFALDGFSVQAAGYVVKPISLKKMSDAMHACRFVFERNVREIELPVGGKDLRVSIADLIYVEVHGKDTILHMKKGELKTRLPLETVEKHLGGVPFLRCNRSYIINMNHVEEMLRDDFLMHGGGLVPIRKNNRKEIKIAMARFTAGLHMGRMETNENEIIE